MAAVSACAGATAAAPEAPPLPRDRATRRSRIPHTLAPLYGVWRGLRTESRRGRDSPAKRVPSLPCCAPRARVGALAGAAASAATAAVLNGADVVIEALLRACVAGPGRAAAVAQLQDVVGDAAMLKRLLDSFEAYLLHAPAEGASPQTRRTASGG